MSQHSIRLLVTCLDPSRRVTGCFGVWGCPQLEKLLEEHNFMRETFGQPTDQELGDFSMTVLGKPQLVVVSSHTQPVVRL